jgi:hypothetical protein
MMLLLLFIITYFKTSPSYIHIYTKKQIKSKNKILEGESKQLQLRYFL